MLNLLIAVLSDSFSDRKSSTVLHGRVAFARVVLRLELLADSFGINRKAASTTRRPSDLSK